MICDLVAMNQQFGNAPVWCHTINIFIAHFCNIRHWSEAQKLVVLSLSILYYVYRWYCLYGNLLPKLVSGRQVFLVIFLLWSCYFIPIRRISEECQSNFYNFSSSKITALNATSFIQLNFISRETDHPHKASPWPCSQSNAWDWFRNPVNRNRGGKCHSTLGSATRSIALGKGNVTPLQGSQPRRTASGKAPCSQTDNCLQAKTYNAVLLAQNKMSN